MTIGCIIQARMGSTRLPRKVMMKADNKNPLLYYVINQIKHSKLIEKIIIATTNSQEDNEIVNFAKKMNVSFFRGDSKDVLDRFYQCAKKFHFSIIVRITADNPLIDPTLADKAIEKFNQNSFDFLTNCIPRTFPQGTEVEIFSFKAFEKAWKEAKKPSEREHVTPYFYNNPEKFKIYHVKNSKNLSKFRWTVDKKEDLVFVQEIISRIKKRPILMAEILNILKKEPKLIKINRNYVLNEGYLSSLKEDDNS